MKKPIKATYKQSTHWVEKFVFTLFLATCIHFALSMYHYTQDGFDAAYQEVVDQGEEELFILFGYHPTITINMLSTMLETKNWLINKVSTFWSQETASLSDKASKLDFSEKKNHWGLGDKKQAVTTWWQGSWSLVKNLCWLFIENCKVVLYKAIVFVYAIPLLAVSSVVGSIDGLIHREIRTQEMGRESSFLFHKFSRLSSRLIATLMMAYFILPLSLSLPLFLLPMALLTCGLSSMTCRHLKKYL